MTTLAEVADRFVAGSPNEYDRGLIFRALELHLELMADRIGRPATVWIDGGFVTHKPEVPNDVDLVYLCRDEAHLSAILAADGIMQLITVQNVIIEIPVMCAVRRMQPVGGKVDAFLATPRVSPFWDRVWSSVKGPDGKTVLGAVKGYLEVTL
jgi:hypothetical protein